ncbi:Cys-tRNA(Pro) deacylase [Fumia xinanensis]|uniref:Cys-tRNA(Pro)/Cys-tRNA(Cys) deacylase n=1 Tax=Fumia xinanensis TaxID=2763659 RepID=A0A926E3F1_9FIRM|nr:Cys-tRNA(Pro) deacylase [Fumia xinanensis]MBC8560571.1 Cys-tRNA(Pro) deacylase [Fumia xinanensis]
MAQDKTNVMRLLDRAKIAYTPHYYDHEDGAIDGIAVAQKMGQPLSQVFKTLVTRGSGRHYYVFVIPVAEELDLKAAAKACGEKSVEMIHVKEINALTGYIRGGCSPIGMKKLFPTFLDESAQRQNTIMVSAGKIGTQVELAPIDLIDFVGAKLAALAKKQ